MTDVPAARGVEAERWVLVVQGMRIAAGEERAHDEVDVGSRRHDAPAQDDHLALVGNEQVVLDLDTVGECPRPSRPGVGREARETLGPVGRHHPGNVALRRQGARAPTRVDRRVAAVDQEHAPGGRPRRRQQQRMVTPRADAGHGARGEAAEAVGLEPLPVLEIRGGAVQRRKANHRAKSRLTPGVSRVRL